VQQTGGLAKMVDITERLLGKSVVIVTDKGAQARITEPARGGCPVDL